MKILQNFSNGQVLTLNHVNHRDLTISYSLYDNDIYFKKDKLLRSENLSIDVNICIKDCKNYNEYIEKISIETLKNKYSLFELVKEYDSWIIKKGSSGKDTKIRILLPNELIIKSMQLKNELYNLIINYNKLHTFSLIGAESTVIYLEELHELEKELLNKYEK